MVLRAMIDFDQNNPLNGGGGVSLMSSAEPQTQRNRFRSRLQNKGGLLQPPSPNEYIASSSPRSTYGIGELNRRITDLKVDNPALSPPQNYMRDTSPKLLELGQNYPNPPSCQYQTTSLQFNHQLQQQIRRDSSNSNTSSSYYSMKSSDVSRRSSQQSHTSSVSTLRPNAANYLNYDPHSFYDPISAGSSRRSSQLSSADAMNYGPPSSQLLSSHLARLQRYSNATNAHPYQAPYHQQNHFYPYNSQMFNNNYGNIQYNYYQQSMQQTPSSSTDRRMSEPIATSSRNVDNDFVRHAIPRPRSTTPTKSLEMLLEPTKEVDKNKKAKEKEASSPSKPHPNEIVVLDVLKTNEKIENCDELVIPDDMVLYLNQHGDEVETPKIKLDLDIMSIDKIKEEDLLSLLAEVDVPKKEDTSDDGATSDDSSVQNIENPNNDDSEINNNGNFKKENDISNDLQHVLCKS